jgi:hypothetical protein
VAGLGQLIKKIKGAGCGLMALKWVKRFGRTELKLIFQNASMPDNGNSGDKDYTSLINGNGTWKNEQGTKTQGCFVEYSVSAVPVLVF